MEEGRGMYSCPKQWRYILHNAVASQSLPLVDHLSCRSLCGCEYQATPLSESILISTRFTNMKFAGLVTSPLGTTAVRTYP